MDEAQDYILMEFEDLRNAQRQFSTYKQLRDRLVGPRGVKTNRSTVSASWAFFVEKVSAVPAAEPALHMR